MHGNRTLTLTTIQSSWHQSVLVRALGATVFGLSAGGIPMEAAHANVYRARAPAPHTGIARSIRIHTTRPLAKNSKRGAPMPPSKV